MITELFASAVYVYLYQKSGGNSSFYYSYAILLTAVADILVMIPCAFLFRRDVRKRKSYGKQSGEYRKKLHPGEIILLLVMGAALSQYANMIVSIFQSYLRYEEYAESSALMMEGKSLMFLIVTMGIIAPLAEEMVFRWLVYLRMRDYLAIWPAAILSGLIFGIYHGNLTQAVYAGILGILFAYFLEITGNIWSSVLLHIGANVWSVIWQSVGSWLLNLPDEQTSSAAIIAVMGILLASLILGGTYFQVKKNRCGEE